MDIYGREKKVKHLREYDMEEVALLYFPSDVSPRTDR